MSFFWPALRPSSIPPVPVHRVVANVVKPDPKPSQDARTMRICPRCRQPYSIGGAEADQPCEDHRPFGSPGKDDHAPVEKVTGHIGIAPTPNESARVALDAPTAIEESDV